MARRSSTSRLRAATVTSTAYIRSTRPDRRLRNFWRGSEGVAIKNSNERGSARRQQFNVRFGSKADIYAVQKPCPLYPQKRTCAVQLGMSALGQKRTHAPQQKDGYSITSSARASSVGGTVRPSCFAVLRLITSSYFVGA